MSTIEHPVIAAPQQRTERKGSILAYWLSSTDHKIIGHMYLITSFFFFLCAGVMAMLMRIQLLGPDQHFVSDQQYNELFTMHGTIMLLLFATPLFIGFANELIPLQIGAPDVAFPRLNLLSYYLFTFGGLILLASFLTPGGSAAFGWYAYSPLTSAIYSPGIGADMWIMGLVLSGFGTILGGVNFITTIFCMRAPGMTMFRMPIFTWNALLTSMMVLMAFPVLAAALLVLEIDRRLGAHVFDAASGGAIMWQNLFWFFGHPEVYILALPFFGIATEIIPVFSRKPLFGYKTLIAATVAIAGLSMTVWAHHMFTTGAVLLPFFSFMSFLIAIPTGVKFFNWTGTMWHGQLTFEPPMLYSIGFLVTFLFGGITGVILASPPLNFAVSDSYFLVAHFHYVLAGTVLFAMFAGFYFWWPKMTGKMLNSTIGKIQFWFMFIGYHMTFLVQHWMGVEGMPRRVANYPDLPGNVTTLNIIATVGSWILALSILIFLWNIYITWRHGEKVTEEDPWGYCSSLEWATSCPPPRHNFYRIPADQVRAARLRGALPAHQVGPGITRNRADDPGHRERAEVGSAHEGRRLAVPRLRDLLRRHGRRVLVHLARPDRDHRARAQRRGRGAHALISGQLSRRPAEVPAMTPWFPAAFRPTAFASWASCSRRGLRLPSRSVYGLVFCVRTSAWMMSLTSQMLTFMPASTRPLRSQNAMNSRASASPGRPPRRGRWTRGGRRTPCSGRTGRNRALVIGDVLAEHRLRRGPRLVQRAPPGDCARLLGEMPVTHREIT